ncbi:multiubiquitin domain-containing protein [Cronobacter dublinensis]|uniref:multiubiquitin domain-containing protein n=1 Tax=Cronobacter dublinensis TaxID=413497 RepID=UPI000CFA85CB|nr:multiubiquitin domain-containing protein [Cronobacter dublinensis]
MNSLVTLSSKPHHSIEIADKDLNFRQVNVDDKTLTGSQISAAAGFKPDQFPVVLQVLANGLLESLSPGELARPGVENNKFIVVISDRTYFFSVDGERLEWPFNQITGHTVRKLGGVSEGKRLLLEKEDTADEEIQVHQFVSLEPKGVERFISRDPVWKLNVQGKVYLFDTPIISVRDAVVRAGLNPEQAWYIFFSVEGKPKEEKTINDHLDLTTPGIEKLRLTPRNVSNGEAAVALRRDFELLDNDENYLNEMGFQWETCANEQSRWLVINDYVLPEGYNQKQVQLVLLIPEGYPMSLLDMFYVFPELKLSNGSEIPATQIRVVIDQNTFQGWSRHRPWDPNTDSVISQLAMANGCLLKEVGQ